MSNWTDISVLWTHFPVPAGAVRTALSKKMYVWRKKRPLRVCVVWANLPRTSWHQNWAMHPHVRNWVLRLRPTLMRAIMKEQSASKNKSKEDRNHGIKHVNENQYFGHLCSCTFKKPKQNGTCNNELQVGNVAHYFHSFSCTSMSEHH